MDPLDQQQNLVETSLDAVFTAYDEAVAARVPVPVVFVVDCEDEVGRQIVEAWVGQEAVEDAIANSSPDEETTVFTTAFSWEDCQRDLGEIFPYLEPVFQGDPPTDGVMVVSVTAGGASALTAPHTARGQ